MARELIVRLWCDLHLAEGEHVEGEELPPVSLDPRAKPKVLALCEVHRKEIFDPLRDALVELGQTVDGAAAAAPQIRKSTRRGGAHQCPALGCDYAGPSRGALSKHTLKHHGTSLVELEAELAAAAATAQLDHQPELDIETEPEQLDDPLTCPECGKHFTMPKGLGAHRSKVHGVKGTSKAARDRRAALGK